MMKNAFDRLAPFIQEYIIKERWNELRGIQVAACEVILETDNNILLSSGTASGKTEAAFLPILTDLYENPSSSVGVLYISPLKALINDQFERLDGLLEYSHIPVCKWHGDVSQSKKQKLLRHPGGVMQTTPESLESLIMRRRFDVSRLFSDLRYIVIDEVHYFMDSPRGIQLLSVLERIQRNINTVPRRVGLSATLGNYEIAEKWLSSGTSKKCITPTISEPKRTLSLYCAYFPLHSNGNEIIGEEEYYNFLYQITDKRKCIVFSNTRFAVEQLIAKLKQLNEKSLGKNKYYVHHGNVSSFLREDAEKTMRESNDSVIIGATVTLELGIDIGSLERVIQTSSPLTVSSFVQRMGRCGRKTGKPEMCFMFMGFPIKHKNLLDSIDWGFVKCIAIIQLYLEERWIETISLPTLPFSILYHQTMSIMYSAAELSPKMLAQQILTLSTFKNISIDDYRIFLNHLLSIGHLEKTERGTLIVGLKAEPILNNYEFFAVFETPIEYTVMSDSEEIGTIQKKFNIGESFCLAGYSWKVKDTDEKSNVIYVEKIQGISKNNWFSLVQVDIQTKLMKKIQALLSSDEVYSYLSPDSRYLLNQIRYEMRGANLLNNEIVKLSDREFLVMPWVGTKAIRVLALYYKSEGFKAEVFARDAVTIGIKISDCDEKSIREVYQRAKKETINVFAFQLEDNEIFLGGKYDDYVDPLLLKKQFLADCLDVYDLQENMFFSNKACNN